MTETLVLGGGCFWCTEAVYVKVRGVTDVESGYCNGHTVAPTYEDVCTGRTGHNEVVKLEYDPAQISIRELLEIFFVIHDPTTLNRQGNDAGTQYRSGIYFTTPEQQQVAQALIAELNEALGGFEANPEIGCTVITGSEKAFAAGADVKEMAEKTYVESYLGKFLDGWTRISETRKPVA